MTEVGIVFTTLAFGGGSALIPILNAEAYLAVNTAVADSSVTSLRVLAMTAGTTVGNVLIFYDARKGTGVLATKTSRARSQAAGLTSDERPDPTGGAFRTMICSWSQRLLRFLDDSSKDR